MFIVSADSFPQRKFEYSKLHMTSMHHIDSSIHYTWYHFNGNFPSGHELASYPLDNKLMDIKVRSCQHAWPTVQPTLVHTLCCLKRNLFVCMPIMSLVFTV